MIALLCYKSKFETDGLVSMLGRAYLEENHGGGVVRAMSRSYGAVLSVMGSRERQTRPNVQSHGAASWSEGKIDVELDTHYNPDKRCTFPPTYLQKKPNRSSPLS